MSTIRISTMALLLLAAGTLPALLSGEEPAPPSALQRPLAFGETVTHLSCLRFSLESLRTGRAGFAAGDWALLRLRNDCPVPVRHVRVVLVLIDGAGEFLAVPLWILEGGVLLPPERETHERYAISNPENLLLRSWQIRVLQAEQLTSSGWDSLVSPRKQQAASKAKQPS